ncbi:MAG: PAS domain-containing sensor histidine kinase [Desulfatiglandales bacterium]
MPDENGIVLKHRKRPSLKKESHGKALTTEAMRKVIDVEKDFFDFSPAGHLALDKDGRITAANLTAAAMLGVPRGEILGLPFYQFVDSEDRDTLDLHIRSLLKHKRPRSCEVRIISQKNSLLWIRLESIFDHDRRGVFAGRMILIDITQQKQLEEDLAEREERLRMVIDGADLGAWDRTFEPDTIIWNRRLYELLGRDPEGPPINGETFFEYIHHEDIDRVRKHLSQSLLESSKFTEEFRVVREDGEIRWLGASARLQRDEKGRPVRMSGINMDITDKKKMEASLRRSQKDLEQLVQERALELEARTLALANEISRRKKYEYELRAAAEKIIGDNKERRRFSKRLVELLEKERRDIAGALHDDVGQILAITSIRLELLKNEMPKDSRHMAGEIDRIQTTIRDCMEHIRGLSRELRPTILDNLGLQVAVENLIEKIRGNGTIDVKLFMKDIPERMKSENKLAIYRIIQESLTNAIKHAEAKRIFVNLVKKAESIALTVEDDGIGFDPAKTHSKEETDQHLGIDIMKERASQVLGSLRVETRPGKGTMVSAEIPIAE